MCDICFCGCCHLVLGDSVRANEILGSDYQRKVSMCDVRDMGQGHIGSLFRNRIEIREAKEMTNPLLITI